VCEVRFLVSGYANSISVMLGSRSKVPRRPVSTNPYEW
jgi:hypothetical protein